jgi:hypothetical protein
MSATGRKFTKGAFTDARWIMTFLPGEAWLAGSFRPRREAELIRLGVLVKTNDPAILRVAHVDLPQA